VSSSKDTSTDHDATIPTSKTREIPFTLVRGFCMGAADIVPGVSGGTIALVFGMYHRLVAAIQTGSSALGRFAKFDFKGGTDKLKAVDWVFLLPLGGGIVLALFSLASLIETQLHENPVEMSALFMGLVAGSVIVAWQLLNQRDPARLAILVGVAVVVFALLGLREGTSEETVAQTADPAMWAYFGAGALAICAMILPGISGSFILVLLGMYGPVLAAVSDRDLTVVVVVGLGAVVGLALFSQVLHWALSTRYDTVMAILIGLMIGSLRVLWPWPNGVDSTALDSPNGEVVLPIILAVLAFGLVIAISEVAKHLEHRSTGDEIDELQAS
jgi:putative membrane protein